MEPGRGRARASYRCFAGAAVADRQPGHNAAVALSRHPHRRPARASSPGRDQLITNTGWVTLAESRLGAPNSRTPALWAKGKIWVEVAEELAQWRSIWTSSGVWDAAIFMAAAVAEKAAHVDALDISRGVLACARVLNGRPNITYQAPAELRAMDDAADVAYSFAVVQHLRTETLEQVLSLLAWAVRSGALLLHFAVPDPVRWRTEEQWRAQGCLAAPAPLRYALTRVGRARRD